MNEVLAQQDIKDRLIAGGARIQTSNRQQIDELTRQDARWRNVVVESGYKED